METEIIRNPDFDPTVVVVGVPTFGMVSIQWAVAMQRLQLMNIRTRQIVVMEHEVGVARDYIVEQSLAYHGPVGERCSHVFFVDDDVIIPPDALMRLLAHKKPIVGGLYYAKTPVSSPLVMNDAYCGLRTDWEDGDLVECAAHGMGCTLIERQVFEAIEPPWFKTVNVEGEIKSHSTEDVFFCRKAKAAGFQPTVDTGLFCPHWHAQERRWYPLDRYKASHAA